MKVNIYSSIRTNSKIDSPRNRMENAEPNIERKNNDASHQLQSGGKIGLSKKF